MRVPKFGNRDFTHGDQGKTVCHITIGGPYLNRGRLVVMWQTVIDPLGSPWGKASPNLDSLVWRIFSSAYVLMKLNCWGHLDAFLSQEKDQKVSLVTVMQSQLHQIIQALYLTVFKFLFFKFIYIYIYFKFNPTVSSRFDEIQPGIVPNQGGRG